MSGEYMRVLMDDFVKAIKAELPNAIISWDISAWIGTAGFTQWFKILHFYQIYSKLKLINII